MGGIQSAALFSENKNFFKNLLTNSEVRDII